MDQARMRRIHWTWAKRSFRGVKPNRECFLASSSLCLPPQSPLFPSLFIASLPLISLHWSFSALLSHSPPLFAEVMTELPWHMLRGWTSRASKDTPALMHSHRESICWMDYCRVTIPTPGPMRWWWKIKNAARKMDRKTHFLNPSKKHCSPLIGQKIFVNNQWSMHNPGWLSLCLMVFFAILLFFSLLIRDVLLFIARADCWSINHHQSCMTKVAPNTS